MAGADAVKDMGDTLVSLLRAVIPAAMVPVGRIFVATPDEFDPLRDPNQPAITVCLYRVAVNPEMRNLPKRTLADGRVARPLLPIELSYLITPWARNTGDEHLLVGRILQALYDRAEIGPAELQGTSWAPGDSVQLFLETMPIEDHFRLWDTIQMPYRLSLAYTARVIGIEPAEALVVPPIVEASFGPRSTS